jgi:hypothetical protein
MKYPTDSPKKSGAWLYDHGANNAPLNGKAVIPEWGKWQSERQPVEVVKGFPWANATGVGVLHGIGGWRCLDIDDCTKFGPVQQILDELGFPHTYPWIVESGSGEGWHIWIRCPDDNAFDNKEVYTPRSGDAFDHLEVRWNRHQTAVPPSVHPDTGAVYEFAGSRPEAPPWEVEAEKVRAAVEAIGTRKRKNRSTTTRSAASADFDDPEVEDIQGALDALPDGYGDDYEEWSEIIRGVKDGAPDDTTAEKLLKDWRSEWEDGEYDEKLASYDGGPPEGVAPTTVGTLFMIAQEHGWGGPYSTSGASEKVDEIVDRVQNEDAGPSLIFENLAAFARLDTTDFAVAKSKISDVVNLNDFKQAIREKRREVQAEDFHRQSERPTVQVSGRPGRDVVDEAIEALHDWNEPPELFQRGTEPAQIAVDDQDRPIIRELPDPVLDDCLDRAADFYRSTKESGAVQADLPKRYVQRIRETIDLPPLDGIVEAPVLRSDGSILDEPGYDDSSRLYYRPDADLTVPDVPEEPTQEDLQRAVKTIWTPLQDFPFVDQASRANALGLMLTPTVRPQLGAQNVPLAIVDATVQGTGKTLLVNVMSLTATGRTAGTMSAPDGDEEWRKQITAQLLQGASMIVVDNVRGRLQNAPLEQALTTSLWQDRVLGKSEQVELPQRATWVATGNNVQPKGDMKRRVYPIRMDAEMERPWTGRDFAIDNLQKWTQEHRGELVASLLTLARGWMAAGRPDPDVELLGSFEEWTRTVGGILETAGVDGFLDNLQDLYKQTDDETAEWAGFLSALHTYFHHQSEEGNRKEPTFTSNELERLIRENYHKDPKLRGRHMTEVVDQLPDYVLQKLNRGDPFSRTLGNMFANRRGRRFGSEGIRIEVAYTRNRAKRWIVRRGQREAGVSNESNESSLASKNENNPPTLDGVGGSSQKNVADTDSLDSSENGEGTTLEVDEAPF